MALGEPETAPYTDRELAFIQSFVKQYEEGLIPIRELVAQINVFHAVKVAFLIDIAPPERRLALAR